MFIRQTDLASIREMLKFFSTRWAAVQTAVPGVLLLVFYWEDEDQGARALPVKLKDFTGLGTPAQRKEVKAIAEAGEKAFGEFLAEEGWNASGVAARGYFPGENPNFGGRKVA